MSRPKSCAARLLPRRVLEQQLVHHVGVEDVDPHRGQRHVGVVGHRRRVLGLLQEAGHAVLAIDPHHAELASPAPRHRQAGDRQIGAVGPVLVDHPGVIHLVDVVAGQDQRIPRRGLLDRVDVLVDRVGRPLVPHLGDPLLRRDHLDVLAQLAAEELPALVDVPVQARRLVLRQHQHLAQVGVDAVRQREVDDPVQPAERDRRLGPVPGQWLQPRPPAPGQDDRQDVAIHQMTSAGCSARPGVLRGSLDQEGSTPLCTLSGDKPTALSLPPRPARAARNLRPFLVKSSGTSA